MSFAKRLKFHQLRQYAAKAQVAEFKELPIKDLDPRMGDCAEDQQGCCGCTVTAHCPGCPYENLEPHYIGIDFGSNEINLAIMAVDAGLGLTQDPDRRQASLRDHESSHSERSHQAPQGDRPRHD